MAPRRRESAADRFLKSAKEEDLNKVAKKLFYDELQTIKRDKPLLENPEDFGGVVDVSYFDSYNDAVAPARSPSIQRASPHPAAGPSAAGVTKKKPAAVKKKTPAARSDSVPAPRRSRRLESKLRQGGASRRSANSPVDVDALPDPPDDANRARRSRRLESKLRQGGASGRSANSPVDVDALPDPPDDANRAAPPGPDDPIRHNIPEIRNRLGYTQQYEVRHRPELEAARAELTRTQETMIEGQDWMLYLDRVRNTPHGRGVLSKNWPMIEHVVMVKHPNIPVQNEIRGADEGDGDCYWRAISLLVYGTMADWLRVKSEHLHWLTAVLRNPDHPRHAAYARENSKDPIAAATRPTSTNDAGSRWSGRVNWVERLQIPGCWSHEDQIALSADLYNLFIVLFLYDSDTVEKWKGKCFDTRGAGAYNNRHVFICLNKGHFQPMIPNEYHHWEFKYPRPTLRSTRDICMTRDIARISAGEEAKDGTEHAWRGPADLIPPPITWPRHTEKHLMQAAGWPDRAAEEARGARRAERQGEEGDADDSGASAAGPPGQHPSPPSQKSQGLSMPDTLRSDDSAVNIAPMSLTDKSFVSMPDTEIGDVPRDGSVSMLDTLDANASCSISEASQPGSAPRSSPGGSAKRKTPEVSESDSEPEQNTPPSGSSSSSGSGHGPSPPTKKARSGSIQAGPQTILADPIIGRRQPTLPPPPSVTESDFLGPAAPGMKPLPGRKDVESPRRRTRQGISPKRITSWVNKLPVVEESDASGSIGAVDPEDPDGILAGPGQRREATPGSPLDSWDELSDSLDGLDNEREHVSDPATDPAPAPAAQPTHQQPTQPQDSLVTEDTEVSDRTQPFPEGEHPLETRRFGQPTRPTQPTQPVQPMEYSQYSYKTVSTIPADDYDAMGDEDAEGETGVSGHLHYPANPSAGFHERARQSSQPMTAAEWERHSTDALRAFCFGLGEYDAEETFTWTRERCIEELIRARARVRDEQAAGGQQVLDWDQDYLSRQGDESTQTPPAEEQQHRLELSPPPRPVSDLLRQRNQVESIQNRWRERIRTAPTPVNPASPLPGYLAQVPEELRPFINMGQRQLQEDLDWLREQLDAPLVTAESRDLRRRMIERLGWIWLQLELIRHAILPYQLHPGHALMARMEDIRRHYAAREDAAWQRLVQLEQEQQEERDYRALEPAYVTQQQQQQQQRQQLLLIQNLLETRRRRPLNQFERDELDMLYQMQQQQQQQQQQPMSPQQHLQQEHARQQQLQQQRQQQHQINQHLQHRLQQLEQQQQVQAQLQQYQPQQQQQQQQQQHRRRPPQQ